MQLQLNFGGFYQSIWDMAFDDEIEMMLSNYDLTDDQNEKFYDSIDWTKSKDLMSKEIVTSFNQFLSDMGLKTVLEFDSLYSPLFYNFETDVIILKDFDLDKLMADLNVALIEYNLHDAFEELLSDSTTSRSGYYAKYSKEDIPDYHIANLMIETIFNDERARMEIYSLVTMNCEMVVFDYELQNDWTEIQH